MAQRRASATEPERPPRDEQPVQRLLRAGPNALADAELLAVVLGDGDEEVCSLRVVQELLEEVDGLAGLQGVPAQALKREGIDKSQVDQGGAGDDDEKGGGRLPMLPPESQAS